MVYAGGYRSRMVKATTVILLVFASSTIAVPGISFPINSQVPPVARVLKLFSFAFSATTFTTSSPPLEFSLAEAPAWLQLDSGSRTFSGTPGAGDVGAKDFELVASDGSGSSTMPVTIIVSADPGPGLGVPLAQQLPAFGKLSASQSLVLYPAMPFSISFGPGTFTNTNDQTNYYAVCANNTPLPSWINFNAKALSFTGITPTFTSPSELPQDFGIELTASDVAGFSGVVANFHMIISDHILAFESETISVDFVPGQPLNSSGLQGRLTLDGKPAQSSDLESLHADTPDWLTIDAKTLYISGNPPESTTSFQFMISATDVYEDTANALIIISANSSPTLISGKIGAANATLGTKFSYTFDRSLFPIPGTEVTLELGTAAIWLKFDASSLTLQGDVPHDLNAQQIVLNLTASHASQSQTQSFELAIMGPRVSTSSASFPQTAGMTVTSSASVTAPPTIQPKVPDNAETGAQGKDIAAAIVLPLVAFLGVGLLAYWCYRRRRKSTRRIRQRTSSQSSIAALKGTISRPFIREDPSHEVMREKPTIHHQRVSSRPPVIPEMPNLRGTFRNSTQQSTVEDPNQSVKRLSRRESRLNIGHGRSLFQTCVSIAKGTRHEERTNFTLIGEQLSRPGEIHSARGRSISKSLNRPPGIGHGKAPNSILPALNPNTHLSQLSRRGSQIPGEMAYGKGIPSMFGGPLGYGRAQRSIQNASSDGSGTMDGSSSSSPRPTPESFPQPPPRSVRLVSQSPLFQSGLSTKERSSQGVRHPSNPQSVSGNPSTDHLGGGQIAAQGSSIGESADRRLRASSIYSRPPSACPVHSPPPVPSIPNPSLKSSPSWGFLKGLKPRQLKSQSSNLTTGSEGRFADAIESEDENGTETNPNPSGVAAVPAHTFNQGGSTDRILHPGPLSANGISVPTWRGSREMHQALGGAHSAGGSSGGQSSASSTGSGGQGEAHQVGVGEVGRKVSVESGMRRNRPVSRNMRAEMEDAFRAFL